MNRFTAVLVVLVSFVGAGWAQTPVSPEAALKAAIQREQIDGDDTGALAAYQAIVRQFPDHVIAVDALLRSGALYERAGNQARARQSYEQVVEHSKASAASRAQARSRLAAIAEMASESPRQVPTGTGTVQRDVGLRRLWAGSTLGTVSRDGRYVSTDDDTGNLVLHDIAAGTDRALTNRDDEDLYGSAISRDGTQVAYQWYSGCAPGRTDPDLGAALCVVGLAGTGVPPSRTLFESKDVSEIAPMDWSPDGRSIAVSLRRADRTAQIGLVDVSTGSLRVLKTVDWRGPTRVFFSPDGRNLAYDLPASETSAQRDIFVRAVDGTREIAAVEYPSQDVVMGWTPDGAHLLFASDRDRTGSFGLWAVPFAAGKPNGSPQLVKPSIGTAWSMGVTNTGALFLGLGVSDRDVSVATIDLTSGAQVAPPVRPIPVFVGTNAYPAWSPDGRYLAYVSTRGFNGNTGRVIGIRSAATGEVRELQPRLWLFGQVNWAPDGKSFVLSGTDLKGQSGVFRIDVATGDVTALLPATGHADPKWSPDGTRLYYRRPVKDGPVTNTPDWSIIERDMASGRERELARGQLGTFNVSPDGHWIAAPSGKVFEGTASAILLIPVDGGQPRELIHAAPSETFPLLTGLPWTPDSGGVIVRKRLSSGAGELWVVPTSGAAPRKLDVDPSRWSFGPIAMITLHPDGRQLAYTSGDIGDEVWVLEDFLPMLK